MRLESLCGSEAGSVHALPADQFLVATQCGHLGLAAGLCWNAKGLRGAERGEQNGHIQVWAFSQAGGLGG